MALFSKVRLDDPERIYRAYPHQLSGGQKQRVLIAMAISCNPDVLIADEPTTSLDVTVQAAVLDLLRDIQKETGMSILFITHDLAVASILASRVMVMYKGRIVEEGAVQTVFENPQHPYTKGLLACRPPLHIRYHTLPVLADFMRTETDGSLRETGLDKDSLASSYVLTEAERKARLEKLYVQKPLLEVKNLVATYAGEDGLFSGRAKPLKAVADVSFDLYPGETLGLVGESGCGKTTLGKCITRLIEPTSGQVLFDGMDVASLEGKSLRQVRRRIQVIFQDPLSSLQPLMKIGEAIVEPMQVHGLYEDRPTRKKKAMELLERVGLSPEHFDRYPDAFSGGQRQRISLRTRAGYPSPGIDLR
jgi:peptide/nickel transport system ATP-binding protein